MLLRARSLCLLAALLSCGSISQSPECKKYIECLNAVEDGRGDSIRPSYDETGTCWGSGEAVAATCTKSCLDGLAAEAMSETAPAECL
jgi:hypothetical protein